MHPDLETQPFARVRWATLQAQREVLMGVFDEAHRIGRAADFLKDPRVLPLCELILNGATSYEGAVLLMSEGFAERGSFVARRGPLSGRAVVTFDPSPEGQSRFEDIREWKQDLFDAALTYLVTDTCVVDNGHGVVATRTMVEIALEIADGALLKRLVDPAAPLGVGQGLEIEERVTPEARRKALDEWLGENVPRSDAAIVDLGGVLRGFSVQVE
ncbi:MAG: hypothetical protein MRY81_11220 [Donghicola eburneus]|nr:hypothetical protein [Donghicola eburneus]MCI5040242.1 hypothetical protein [Donghicola eburneus]